MEQQTSIIGKLLNGDSAFSTNGERPQINTTAGENNVQRFFDGSALDMDGVTPIKYSDKTPEGQSGRI